MSKHTPGPWEARPVPSLGLVEVAQAGMAQPFAEVFYDPKQPVPPTLYADARLIASAPELLAALREIATLPEWLGSDPAYGTGHDAAREAAAEIARAAIAKAEG